MSVSSLRVLPGIAALALLAHCDPAADQVDPPDISRLLAAYAEPTGTIDTARPAVWLEAAQTQLDLLGGGATDVLVHGLLASAAERVEQASLPSGGDGLFRMVVDGLLTFEVQCGAPADGTANVAVPIVDGEASPLLWGTAHACLLWKGSGIRATYDGSFAIYRYPDADLFVRLDGTITGIPTPIQLDFRLARDRVETRLATSTGEVIAARDGADLVARAANGTFRCDTSEKSCFVPALAP